MAVFEGSELSSKFVGFLQQAAMCTGNQQCECCSEKFWSRPGKASSDDFLTAKVMSPGHNNLFSKDVFDLRSRGNRSPPSTLSCCAPKKSKRRAAHTLFFALSAVFLACPSAESSCIVVQATMQQR